MMDKSMAEVYGLQAGADGNGLVGFNKVTVARDNPTPLRAPPCLPVTDVELDITDVTDVTPPPLPSARIADFDENNYGFAVLLIITIGTPVGGSHVLFNHDLTGAVVVEDCPYGMLIAGEYSKVLHANTAVMNMDKHNGRFIINGYCLSSLIKRIGGS